jgi:hypothetical protein
MNHGAQHKIPVNRERARRRHHLVAMLFRSWRVSSLQGLLAFHKSAKHF